jgi:hypothetical protein
MHFDVRRSLGQGYSTFPDRWINSHLFFVSRTTRLRINEEDLLKLHGNVEETELNCHWKQVYILLNYALYQNQLFVTWHHLFLRFNFCCRDLHESLKAFISKFLI